MVRHLQTEALAFSGENRLVIFNPQVDFQDLHRHLSLFNYGTKSFDRTHVAAAITSAQALIEDFLQLSSNSLVA